MGSSEAHIQPLHASIEMLSNLIYLARQSGTRSEQQNAYLDQAATVIEEMAHHPMAGRRFLEWLEGF